MCATATATLPDERPTPIHRPAAPLPPLPAAPPAASPDSLAVGTTVTLPVRPVTADDQAAYRADVREALGPWIHVGSDVHHHAAVRVGDEVGGRGVVAAEWERKGHRFVTLDIELIVVDGDTETVTATIAHTAIYRPRG